MSFHRARIKSNTRKISIRNNVIDEVKSTKFLGIVLDDKLKWTDCRFGALPVPTEPQRETSFHRLCVAFVESVSLQLCREDETSIVI